MEQKCGKVLLLSACTTKRTKTVALPETFPGVGRGDSTYFMYVRARICMHAYIYMYARLKKFLGRGLNPAGYASGPSNGGIAISPRAVVTFDSHCSGPVVSCQVKKT